MPRVELLEAASGEVSRQWYDEVAQAFARARDTSPYALNDAPAFPIPARIPQYAYAAVWRLNEVLPLGMRAANVRVITTAPATQGESPADEKIQLSGLLYLNPPASLGFNQTAYPYRFTMTRDGRLLDMQPIAELVDPMPQAETTRLDRAF